jgi:hypothetical protein
MNIAAQTFVAAIASVAAAAAIGITLANGTAEPATDVVKLDRVVVMGHRTDNAVIAKLPRVVIEQRRDATVATADPADRAI